ncbi:MAG: hypothetical protein JJE52_06115 [Acidimicrobiia bacterium]|nr:hypothetical protein [Acidimicrobiia bacterium]
MSWHPSRASRRALDPAAPTRYRSATVQSSAGRSMLVHLDDGDDRLLPVPPAPLPTLVGSTVMVAGEHDWVVAIVPSDPLEEVALTAHGLPVVDLRADRDLSTDPDANRPLDLARFNRRAALAESRRRHARTAKFRRIVR